MVYKKCSACGETKVPVARKNCPSCGFSYKKEVDDEDSVETTSEIGKVVPKVEVKTGLIPTVCQSKIKVANDPVSVDREWEITKDEEKRLMEDADEDTEYGKRPKRNVRKPLLLRHEMAVAAAVAAETSSMKTRGWKSMMGKRGSRGAVNVKRKRGSSLTSPAAGRGRSVAEPALTVRTLLAQRRPRGRPRSCHAAGSSFLDHRSSFKTTPGRGAGVASASRPWNLDARGGDDDDDDDFGLTVHQKKLISESLDQTRGQRTRQLIPRRAAHASLALSSDQLQGANDDANDSNASDSNSPNSSKSASPSPAEDAYTNLPPYRLLQYGIVLGDINRKFLNQSFKPV